MLGSLGNVFSIGQSEVGYLNALCVLALCALLRLHVLVVVVLFTLSFAKLSTCLLTTHLDRRPPSNRSNECGVFRYACSQRACKPGAHSAPTTSPVCVVSARSSVCVASATHPEQHHRQGTAIRISSHQRANRHQTYTKK